MPSDVAPRRAGRVVGQPPYIVLLEDDEEMRVLLTGTLVGAGYRVVVYPSGLELLEILEAAGGLPAPIDLVISDVRMPGVSGLCLLEGIQAWGGDPPPRMILITAFGDPELHARARRAGAVAVVNKPFEMENLLGVVSEALRAARA